MEVLKVDNLVKFYNGVEVVKKVSFTVKEGEILAIIGASGSGKSTLIKLILKEEEPTSGNIIINGKDTTFLKPKRVPYLRRSMGVVFQDFRLLPDKTVYENVAFAMYIVKATPRHIRRQVPMVLSLVGLSDKAKVYPNELSGGEQQRVALARALVNNPSMIIADEPTGNLDPDTAWEIMTLLNDINARGTTVVVATHAKDIVDKMKKRVIQIEKGNIVRDDKYSTLKTAEYLYGEGKKYIDQYDTSAVCMFKIINLEKINEDISRKTGDAIITNVCKIIKDNLAQEYIFVRYMGPKFAIVFSGIEPKSVENYLIDIKGKVEDIELEPVDVEFEDGEDIIANPKLNMVITSYYKGTALEGVLKKLEEYLDKADANENTINYL